MRRWGRAGRTGHVDSLAATVASAAVLLLAGCAAPPGTSPSDPAPTGVETTASPQPSATGEPSSTPGEHTAEPSATALRSPKAALVENSNGMTGTAPLANITMLSSTGSISRPSALSTFTNVDSVCTIAPTSQRCR